MTKQETWVDENTKKEVMLAETLIDRKKHSEVTKFTDEAEEKLSNLYEDDLIIVTSEYQKGVSFEVQEVLLVDEVLEEEFGDE